MGIRPRVAAIRCALLLALAAAVPSCGGSGGGSGGSGGSPAADPRLLVRNSNPFTASGTAVAGAFSNGASVPAGTVMLTFDRLDLSQNGTSWVTAAGPATIDLLDSSSRSEDGSPIPMEPIPPGAYLYARLYITKLVYVEAGVETDLRNQFKALCNTKLDPMYFSYDGVVPGAANGVTDLLYRQPFEAGTMMPFVANGTADLFFYFVVPPDFVADRQLICKPKLTLLPSTAASVSDAHVGTVSGTISGIASATHTVFVGAYRDFQVDVAPNFFVKATHQAGGTATYSMRVPPGTYKIIALEDADMNMSATVFPSAADRAFANGAVPAGVTATGVAAGADLTENLSFSNTLSNIPEYGGRLGDSAARLTVNVHRLQGLVIDTSVARIFLRVHPEVGSDPLRVDIGNVNTLATAVSAQTLYRFTFANMPTGDYYFSAHLDMNGNGIDDPGDFTAQPILHTEAGGSSLVPFTVLPGGTVASPVNLNSSNPIFLQWAVRDVPYGNASVNAVDGWAYAVADFNGDGKPDLATGADHTTTVHADADKIGIHLGKGDGTFAARVDYASGIDISHLAPGDVDGDGDVDLVSYFVNPARGFKVHLNNGAGAFPAVNSYAITAWDSIDLLVVDLNGDGDLDVVIATDPGNGSNAQIRFFAGNGDGTFQGAVSFGAPPGLMKVKAGDVNGDGKRDLVAVSGVQGFYGVSAFTVFLNNGMGPLAAGTSSPLPHEGAFDLALADLDGDGDLDATMSPRITGGGTKVVVRLGNGNGTFGSPSEYDTLYGSNTLALADFDGDSDIDFAIGSSNGFGVFVHAGAGNGTVPAGKQYTPLFPARNLQAHDMNRDGKPDLVWAVSNLSTPAGLSEARVYIVLAK